MASAAAIGGVVASVGGSLYSSRKQKKAAKKANAQNALARAEEEKANAISRASATVEANRRRKQAVANARLVRAQNTALASAEGISGTSSPIAGASSAVSSSAAGNVAGLNRSFFSEAQTFDTRQGAQGFRSAAYDAQAKGQKAADNIRGLQNAVSFGTNLYSIF